MAKNNERPGKDGSSSPESRNAFSGPAGWVVTAIAAIAIIAAAIFLRNQFLEIEDITEKDQHLAAIDKQGVLPFTRRLVVQKITSLQRYNDDRPLKEMLDFLESQTGHVCTPESFAELSRQIVDVVIPLIWERCERGAMQPVILHEPMHRWIQTEFPHRTLTNADVILYPNVKELRIVVSEPNTDFFRDSALHWKWIGEFADKVSNTDNSTDFQPIAELDVYAAEELSEFLSVIGVAVFQIAARDEVKEGESIDAVHIEAVFKRMSDVLPELANHKGIKKLKTPFLFSAETKKKVLASFPNPMFRDITTKTGLDFIHRMSEANAQTRTKLLTTVGFGGGGVSINDFDNDGDQDVYFAGDLCGQLFRNENGTFTDISASAGIPSDGGETRAGYFVDFDNDGDNDLFLTRVGRPHMLLENDGNGKLTDVAQQLNFVSGNRISHEAVWCDINNDGLLDVYVANFGNWLAGETPTLGRINVNASPNELFIQQLDADGNRSFKEVAKEYQVDDRGWTHCVAAYDYDRDGWTDLFSLNDFGASMLYRNLEGKGFEEVSASMKIDDVYNAMNFTLMDLRHNGEQSIYVSQIMKLIHRQRYKRPTEQTRVIFDPNIVDNMRIIVANCLITRNEQEKHFDDDHNVLIEPAELGWSWGVTAYDYENDTDEDLIIANGTEPKSPRFWKGRRNFVSIFANEANVCYAQEGNYFYDVSSINPIAFKGNSRCAMPMDIDSDGDLDIFLANYDAPAQVYENLQTQNNNWVRFRLVGTKSNRNAIGARVQVKFAGQSRYGEVVSGSGYLSQPSYELHFGLGSSKEIEEIIIEWPSGRRQIVKGLEINRSHEIVEEQ